MKVNKIIGESAVAYDVIGLTPLEYQIQIIMCLYTKMIMPAKARKDIVCYKVVELVNILGMNMFVTPVRLMEIKLNSKYTINRSAPVSDMKLLKMRKVSEGYFHCYTGKMHALLTANYPLRNNRYVIECIIPKGTLYYKSVIGDEICAKTLITKEIVSK